MKDTHNVFIFLAFVIFEISWYYELGVSFYSSLPKTCLVIWLIENCNHGNKRTYHYYILDYTITGLTDMS